jgi:SAM-dependent methyltransferase
MAARIDERAMRGLVDALLRRYARAQARDVAPWIVGARLLDLGAGEGYVADQLRAPARLVCAVDVGAFRRAGLAYVVYDGAHLPFADGAFDTTLLLLVLHHCEKPAAVLDEALRVTRHRLIVTESVHRNRLDLLWLRLLDARVNRFRHDGAMRPPTRFGAAGDWEALFASRGLRAVARRWLGSRAERLVHHPWLCVLTRDVAPGARPPTRVARPPAAVYTTSSVRAVVSPKRPSA